MQQRMLSLARAAAACALLGSQFVTRTPGPACIGLHESLPCPALSVCLTFCSQKQRSQDERSMQVLYRYRSTSRSRTYL